MRDPHSIIAAAMAITAEHHEGHIHGGGTVYEVPMVVHTMEVAVATRQLRHFANHMLSMPPHVIFAAGLLHDAPEDTQLGRERVDREILDGCGPDVAYMVDLITDIPAPTRKESKALTLPRIATCPNTTYLKICDRFINQGGAIDAGSVRFSKLYSREYDDFKVGLEPALPCAPLWDILDAQRDSMLAIVEEASTKSAMAMSA